MTNHRGSFYCVDRAAELVPGMAGNEITIAQICCTETTWTGLPCPLYVALSPGLPCLFFAAVTKTLAKNLHGRSGFEDTLVGESPVPCAHKKAHCDMACSTRCLHDIYFKPYIFNA